MERRDETSGKINDYRDLNVWKDSMELAAEIYLATKAFPREELFGMTSQMRRAAVSIPANIAEGFGRGQRKPFVQFLRVAQGSLKELETHTLLSMRFGLLDEKSAGVLSVRFEKLGKMMRSFIRSLEVGAGK
ncbi:four helix bundle protein [Mesorhizobium sp.]|uniref:four helix bundle protein n=1 Tax=Mesorhizobium sp. TaxID=1871066 RepID=UPI000FE6EB62|nr:four helix bundle protein [Mesorhizobium sp.]RWK55289.1 MAG: four helix bundle protein [Mesorhizobium sp.]TIP43237.1 MAG: four helix bundle protein [Mesorhizobium sp.]